MPELRFEWDSKKAAANLAKHGVPFSEAKTAFSDELGFVLEDPAHSAAEERFILLGLSATFGCWWSCIVCVSAGR